MGCLNIHPGFCHSWAPSSLWLYQSIRPLLRFRRSRALQVVDVDIRNDSDISILPYSADLLRESCCSRLDHRCSLCFFVFIYLFPFWSSGLLAMSTALPLPDTVFWFLRRLWLSPCCCRILRSGWLCRWEREHVHILQIITSDWSGHRTITWRRFMFGLQCSQVECKFWCPTSDLWRLTIFASALLNQLLNTLRTQAGKNFKFTWEMVPFAHCFSFPEFLFLILTHRSVQILVDDFSSDSTLQLTEK